MRSWAGRTRQFVTSFFFYYLRSTLSVLCTPIPICIHILMVHTTVYLYSTYTHYALRSLYAYVDRGTVGRCTVQYIDASPSVS